MINPRLTDHTRLMTFSFTVMWLNLFKLAWEAKWTDIDNPDTLNVFKVKYKCWL